MSQGNADQVVRLGSVDAAKDGPQTHPRIDDNRNRSDEEQRKGQHDQFVTRSDEQKNFVPPFNALVFQKSRTCTDVLV